MGQERTLTTMKPCPKTALTTIPNSQYVPRKDPQRYVPMKRKKEAKTVMEPRECG